MKQTLNLKLAQQLTLTPQLKQSLRLLQLSSIDLEHEIQEHIDSNPLLELLEPELNTTNKSADYDELSESALGSQFDGDTFSENFSGEERRSENHRTVQNSLEPNWQEQFESRRTSTSGTSNVTRDEYNAEFTQFISKQESLLEHLDWQVQMTMLSQKDKVIASTILHSLNKEGYLETSLSELQSLLNANKTIIHEGDDSFIDVDEIQAVLQLIKTLDPIGAGAKDLSERLSILLNAYPSETDSLAIAQEIVTYHLDLLGSHNLSQLKKSINITDADLSAALQLITQLNPRIGNRFKSDSEAHIIPDVIVKKVDSIWQAELNPENQFKLRTNETYSRMLKANLDKEQSSYIQDNLQQAKMFIKGLMSRYDTLLLVAQVIVERQQAFFERGEEAMEPMVLQDVAHQLELHESTISRATSGKYLLSPRGVYEMKFFFSSALSNTTGSDSSSTAIRSLIKKIVAHEEKNKPLSDNKISKELEQQGHIVARRTVAKYRESMQIAPSSQRKSLIQ